MKLRKRCIISFMDTPHTFICNSMEKNIFIACAATLIKLLIYQRWKK
jgi:hypothetical protein